MAVQNVAVFCFKSFDFLREKSCFGRTFERVLWARMDYGSRTKSKPFKISSLEVMNFFLEKNLSSFLLSAVSQYQK